MSESFSQSNESKKATCKETLVDLDIASESQRQMNTPTSESLIVRAKLLKDDVRKLGLGGSSKKKLSLGIAIGFFSTGLTDSCVETSSDPIQGLNQSEGQSYKLRGILLKSLSKKIENAIKKVFLELDPDHVVNFLNSFTNIYLLFLYQKEKNKTLLEFDDFWLTKLESCHNHISLSTEEKTQLSSFFEEFDDLCLVPENTVSYQETPMPSSNVDMELSTILYSLARSSNLKTIENAFRTNLPIFGMNIEEADKVKFNQWQSYCSNEELWNRMENFVDDFKKIMKFLLTCYRHNQLQEELTTLGFVGDLNHEQQDVKEILDRISVFSISEIIEILSVFLKIFTIVYSGFNIEEQVFDKVIDPSNPTDTKSERGSQVSFSHEGIKTMCKKTRLHSTITFLLERGSEAKILTIPQNSCNFLKQLVTSIYVLILFYLRHHHALVKILKITQGYKISANQTVSQDINATITQPENYEKLPDLSDEENSAVKKILNKRIEQAKKEAMVRDAIERLRDNQHFCYLVKSLIEKLYAFNSTKPFTYSSGELVGFAQDNLAIKIVKQLKNHLGISQAPDSSFTTSPEISRIFLQLTALLSTAFPVNLQRHTDLLKVIGDKEFLERILFNNNCDQNKQQGLVTIIQELVNQARQHRS